MNAGAQAGRSAFTEFCAAGLWPGVGPALTGHLADAGIEHGGQVTEEALAALPTVTDKRARRLYSAWISAAPAFAVAALLVPLDLPCRWAARLVQYLGSAADDALRRDPWRLLTIREASVAQADGFARSIEPDVRRDDLRRGRALVERALRQFARDGHTVTPAMQIGEELRRNGVAADQQRAAMDAAVQADLAAWVSAPDGGSEPWLASPELARAERDLAAHVLRLQGTAELLAERDAVDTVTSGLDDAQTSAVIAVMESGVSMLTGGPGTGKSRTVAAVVRLCMARGIDIALAAPTGRAAKRLTELLDAAADGAASAAAAAGPQAMTIHRLLGARRAPDGEGSIFERDEDDPIEAQVVVVDEASMLDVELAAALLRATADGAHLMIVGDPAQLPAIGPGKVLADLLAARRFPTTTLDTLYRQAAGGAIARLATHVRGGELSVPDPGDREVVVVPASDSTVAGGRVVQLVTDSIPRTFALSGENVQVITPIHRGPAGTGALNRALKAALNPGRGTVRGFDVGDRVVATANHVDAEPTGYANGEVGTVRQAAGKKLIVTFPGGDAEVSGSALGDLVHGWAITVHRAQGSEWDAVVVVLPPEAQRMLSRPLVYTAMTRARRHLSIVHAAGPAVARAVRHIGARPRRTLLEHLLTHDAAVRSRQEGVDQAD